MCDFSVKDFLCDFLVAVLVSSLLHFILVSIKLTVFVCCSCFSFSSEFMIIIIFQGNIGQIRLSISISDRTHGDFNSKEVGMELSQSLLTLFEPSLDGMALDTSTEKSLDELLIPIHCHPRQSLQSYQVTVNSKMKLRMCLVTQYEITGIPELTRLNFH